MSLPHLSAWRFFACCTKNHAPPAARQTTIHPVTLFLKDILVLQVNGISIRLNLSLRGPHTPAGTGSPGVAASLTGREPDITSRRAAWGSDVFIINPHPALQPRSDHDEGSCHPTRRSAGEADKQLYRTFTVAHHGTTPSSVQSVSLPNNQRRDTLLGVNKSPSPRYGHGLATQAQLTGGSPRNKLRPPLLIARAFLRCPASNYRDLWEAVGVNNLLYTADISDIYSGLVMTGWVRDET